MPQEYPSLFLSLSLYIYIYIYYPTNKNSLSLSLYIYICIYIHIYIYIYIYIYSEDTLFLTYAIIRHDLTRQLPLTLYLCYSNFDKYALSPILSNFYLWIYQMTWYIYICILSENKIQTFWKCVSIYSRLNFQVI